VAAFQELDQRISSVGAMAVRIGARLQAIEQQRYTTFEGAELLNYFLELNSGTIKSPIFTDKTKIREPAKLLKKLLQIT
jgi:hypothetical protein